MSALDRNRHQIWDQLRASRQGRRDHLLEVQIKNLRGIAQLHLSFDYPVSVLAGPNGCGKTTLLMALAAAYRDPERGPRDLVPSSLFPNFQSADPTLPFDERATTELAYELQVGGRRGTLRWRRSQKGWNRSGWQGMPERRVYLRTLANLSNPSEVRSLLQLSRKALQVTEVDAAHITLALRILQWRYRRLDVLSTGRANRQLLFAHREGEGGGDQRYSEFHFSSGERSIVRLSMDLTPLRDALVLIDEVETGLHPFTLQVLMMELQRLALRNNLQIVVASHSPVVLESVPPEARIFLERRGDNVVRLDAFKDLMQRAFYGQSSRQLSVLCEDEEAEGVIRGILDVLQPRLNLAPGDVLVGRDTGKSEFLHHAKAFHRIRRSGEVVFVLDGDARAEAETIRNGVFAPLGVFLLPGNESPQAWAWSTLKRSATRYAEPLGVSAPILTSEISALDALYSGAADKPGNIDKNRFIALAERLSTTGPEVLRRMARHDCAERTGEIMILSQDLEDAILAWRG